MKKIVFTFIVIMTFVSCLNKENSANTENIRNKTTKQDKYFKGIIHFKETYHGISEKINKNLITITIDGESVKREVKNYSFGILDNTVGMVYKANSDSVFYYHTKKDKTHAVKIVKADYLNWVANKNFKSDSPDLIIDNYWISPFGEIFAPLTDKANIDIKIAKNITLLGLKNCELMSMLFDKNKTCSVIYSNEIKLAPGILELIEYNQPNNLKTIALSVKYNLIEKSLSSFDKLVNKPLKIRKPSLDYNGHENQEKPIIELPKNTIILTPDNFNAIINPPSAESSGSGGGHHHDFF